MVRKIGFFAIVMCVVAVNCSALSINKQIHWGSLEVSTEVDVWNLTMFDDGVFIVDVNAHRTFGTIDSMLYLFRGDVMWAYNDDCPWSTWDGGVSKYDSRLDIYLEKGDYQVMIGDYYLTEEEAWLGFNDYNYEGGIGGYVLTTWSMTGAEYDFSPANGEPVPEPAMIVLFGMGLLGFGWVQRRNHIKMVTETY